MTKESKYEDSTVTIEWPYENHIPALRCPVTGMVISLGFGAEQVPEVDSPLEPADEKCPTLLFRYNHEAGMEYLQSRFAKLLEQKKQKLVEHGDFDHKDDIDELEVISELLDDLGESPLIMNVTTRGLPGNGIVIGLDLSLAIPHSY